MATYDAGNQGVVQTSASWLSGGSSQRQITPRRLHHAPASLGQSAAWAALDGHSGLCFLAAQAVYLGPLPGRSKDARAPRASLTPGIRQLADVRLTP
eukprot:scaffold115565_cov60-Phaeocystis_antarctica.AAC.1